MTTTVVAALGGSCGLSLRYRVVSDVVGRDALWCEVYGFVLYGAHELLPIETTLQEGFAEKACQVCSLPLALDVAPHGMGVESAVKTAFLRWTVAQTICRCSRRWSVAG